MAEGNTLFAGLKKLLFKDDETTATQAPAPSASSPEPPPRQAPVSNPAPSFVPRENIPAEETDETTRAKAYQLLESINQPGVDFLEVWNAAAENGGVSGLKAAFNALKYADKSLTREKVLSTGRYYTDALQKALDADLQKKAAQQKALEDEKATQRQSLGKEVSALEEQISGLQNTLSQKRSALAELDNSYEPRLRELEGKMASGKTTIEALLRQMQEVLAAAEKEL